MPKNTSRTIKAIPFEDLLIQDLQDPSEAASFINAAIEEGDKKLFLLALRQVVQARGWQKVAETTKIKRESLSRMLSNKGNPEWGNLNKIMESLGLKITVNVYP